MCNAFHQCFDWQFEIIDIHAQLPLSPVRGGFGPGDRPVISAS